VHAILDENFWDLAPISCVWEHTMNINKPSSFQVSKICGRNSTAAAPAPPRPKLPLSTYGNLTALTSYKLEALPDVHGVTEEYLSLSLLLPHTEGSNVKSSPNKFITRLKTQFRRRVLTPQHLQCTSLVNTFIQLLQYPHSGMMSKTANSNATIT